MKNKSKGFSKSCTAEEAAKLAAAHCGAKNKYRSKGHAKQIISRMKKNLPLKSPLLDAYKCKLCGAYHIGNSYRKVSRP